mgnify:CR=1 FL=1
MMVNDDVVEAVISSLLASEKDVVIASHSSKEIKGFNDSM